MIAARLDAALAELAPDIVNVHNLHGAAWSPDLVGVCCRHAPTVFTLHDMWSFTGRCAYNYDCRKFVAGCDSTCPTPGEYPALPPRRIHDAWRSRERLFADHSGLVAITPSQWLAREARTGLWRDHRVECIPYGLPLGIYRPEDREVARRALGIVDRGPILLTAAADLGERRKGGALLVAALKRLTQSPVTLLTLGRGRLVAAEPGVRVRSLGYIAHERTKALVYNAADILVHPAPVDNLPNVVLEAIACGTPVAALPIGGLPDVVQSGRSGWLAEEATASGLAAAIERALADVAGGHDLRTRCRELAETQYSSQLQATRYVKLFRSIIGWRGK